MVNGLPSPEEGTALRLETARLSLLGRPVGSSPEGSRTDRESARIRTTSRNGSRQCPAPDPKRGGRAGRRVGPGKDGGSEGRAYSAHGEWNEGVRLRGPAIDSDHQ